MIVKERNGGIIVYGIMITYNLSNITLDHHNFKFVSISKTQTNDILKVHEIISIIVKRIKNSSCYSSSSSEIRLKEHSSVKF